MISKKLKEYIETNIFPLYEYNDLGHNIDHINYVIDRSLKLAEQFKNINLDMVYVIAAYHDVGHHINKEKHEVLSALMFYENEDMKKFFTDEERKIIKEAIEDHRASLDKVPRSDYGKIISSADRNIDVSLALKRTYDFRNKHNPDYNLEEIIEDSYKYLKKKFGKNGYAKNYCDDKEYEKFKEDMEKLLENKDKFIVKFKEVNEINQIKKVKKI